DLVVLVDVTGSMRRNRARNLGDVEHALFSLLHEQLRQLLPDLLRAGSRWREEGFVPVIRGVVQLDEGADVDLPLPERSLESLPGRLGRGCLLLLRCG